MKQHGADEILSRDEVRMALSSFGERVRELRLARSWSLAEAAQASGITRSYWSKLETGDHNPGLEALLRIQRALDLDSLDSLFGPLPSRALSRGARSQSR